MPNHIRRFFIFIVLIVLPCLSGFFFDVDEQQLERFFVEVPPLVSWIIFIVLYVVLTTVIWWGPKDVLRLIAAVIYGAWLSTILLWIGEMINLLILFLMSRHFGREFVVKNLKVKSTDIQQTKESTAFWRVVTLRFLPIPFRFLDIGFGLSNISLTKYFLISLFVTPLRIFWVQFILAALGQASMQELMSNPYVVVQYFLDNVDVLKYGMVYVILSAAGLFVVYGRTKNKN